MPDIIRKSFTPGEFKLDEAGAIVVAFAQLNVIDKDADVTLTGAIPAKAVPMSDYGHTSWDGRLPIGKGTTEEAAGWGVFRGQFLMETDQGRNAYHTVKAMADLQEWSYGLNPLDYSYGQQDGRAVRFLKLLDIYEVSPVLVGAGNDTHTVAIKGGRPGTDAPFAEYLTWLLGEEKAALDRTEARIDMRTKEGRVLSAANVALLEELCAAMEGHTKSLRDLISSATPPKAADLRRTEIELLIGRARAAGIPV